MQVDRRWVVVIAMICTAGIGCRTSLAQAYRVYVIRPPINNKPVYDGMALPVVCRDETNMKIMAARGEYEPASFLVQTDRPLKQVMVRVEQLKGEAGALDNETVDVRIARKAFHRYLNMWKRYRDNRGNESIPWILVHDPGMWEIVDGHPKQSLDAAAAEESPEGMPPAEYLATHAKMNRLTRPLVDTETLQPGDVEDFRQFWLTVHIPDDAASGTYRAPVTVSAQNAPETVLTLEVVVPGFDLLPPKFEYSVYYPVVLLRDDMSEAEIARFNPLTERQYLAELRNMMAHGCTNPNIYAGAQLDKNGHIAFTQLSRCLDLREKVGMGPGGPIYIFTGGGVIMRSDPLTAQENRSSAEATRKVVAWVRARGYSDVYFMAGDELTGDRLRGQRDSFQAIHDGGGKVWVACLPDFFEFVGDLLDCPVLRYSGGRRGLMTPEIQKSIKGVHKNGFKIITYYDPRAGCPFPEEHRAYRCLGLWKTGIDGTMTWAYTHIWKKTIIFGDPVIEQNGMNVDSEGFVLRGPEGPLDMLTWEAYREGYDDARYLATLQDAIAKARAQGKHPHLVADTEHWLDNITVDADLDAWRWEMANRTQALLTE